MSNNDKKFVIFDLDGTLIDSNECVLRCMLRSLYRLKLDGSLISPKIQSVDSLFSDVEKLFPDEPMPEIKRLFDKEHFLDTKGINIKRDSLSLLRKYSILGFRIVILTNKWQPIAEKIIRELGLNIYCDYIVGRQNTNPIKDDAIAVRKALNYYGLKLEDCNGYFGDSVKDESLSRILSVKYFKIV